MLGAYGHNFTYDEKSVTIPANTTKEFRFRTLKHFQFLTGLTSFNGYSTIIKDNIIVSIRQGNKFLINSIPLSFITISNNIDFFKNFIRFSALANGEDIFIIIKNNNTSNYAIRLTFLYSNQNYKQIYNFDYDVVSIVSSSTVAKLNINSDAHNLDFICIREKNASGTPAIVTIRDNTVIFLNNTLYSTINAIRDTDTLNKMLPIDIPVSDIYLNMQGTMSGEFYVFYAYKIDSIGPVPEPKPKILK